MSRISGGPNKWLGLDQITGDTVDISEWLDFDFYDYVWYWNMPHLNILKDITKIGCWLGVLHMIKSNMCYWLINENSNVLSQTTVQHVTQDDAKTDEMKVRLEEFDEKLDLRLNDTNFVVENAETDGFFLDKIGYADDRIEMAEENAIEQDYFTVEGYDQHIGGQVIVMHGDDMVHGKVIKQARG